jgi:CRP/FNR family cyclic AMP-dependent transcriptional regulator
MRSSKFQPAVEALGSVDLFEDLSKRELFVIHELAKELRFPAGRAVAKEGTSGGRFFLILEGKATVSVGGKTIGTLGPGDYFGELSLIDGQPRSATVVADSPLRALTLTAVDFRPLLLEQPRIARKIMTELVRRLRDADASLVV